MKPSINVSVNLETRPAEFKRPFATNNMPANTPIKCDVFGLFQCSDSDGADAYFVVELEDGTCTYVLPNYLRFTDRGESRE